jgi:hypothetical protein
VSLRSPAPAGWNTNWEVSQGGQCVPSGPLRGSSNFSNSLGEPGESAASCYSRFGVRSLQGSGHLHAGKIVDVTIKAVIDATDGVKYQVDFGHDQTALIDEWQIIKDN